MTTFIPGLELSRLFYEEAVRPILDARFPGLRYSAALIGPGSEVLGFDTAMSTDHHWGPRLMLFLGEDDFHAQRDRLFDTLARELPYEFHGYTTNFGAPLPEEPGTRLLETIDEGPVNHRVEFYTVRGFFEDYMQIDPFGPIEPRDWVTLPAQRLRTVTQGAVYHDAASHGALGSLAQVRERFAYYPRDVWLYLLACGWQRISQDEHLMPRAGYVGDEVGSAIIGARLARDVMQLCFLMERQYAPYAKWLGTAFKQLSCAALYYTLQAALAATTWQAREAHLVAAFEHLAGMHNALGITEPLDPAARQFHGRPFRIIGGERFFHAIRAAIKDEAVLALPLDTGSVDQFSDSTDVYTFTRERLKNLYG